jgi:hypothetical protein
MHAGGSDAPLLRMTCAVVAAAGRAKQPTTPAGGDERGVWDDVQATQDFREYSIVQEGQFCRVHHNAGKTAPQTCQLTKHETEWL